MSTGGLSHPDVSPCTCLAKPYPVQERAANVLARHLSVQERDVVHLEHAVVSVDEVGLVLAVDEHHVPGAVSLPGNL